MSSETTTVKFMGEDVVVPKTVTYDRAKTLEENLSAAGVDPAEFEKLFEQWYAGLIAKELGVEVKQMGGADYGKLALGLSICVSGAAAGALVYMNGISAVPFLQQSATAACTHVAATWTQAAVPVNASVCAIAQNAVNTAFTTALTNALTVAGPMCTAGFTLVMASTGSSISEVDKYTASTTAALKETTSALQQTAAAQAAQAKQFAKIQAELSKQKGEANEAFLEDLGDAAAKGVAAVGKISAAAPGGPAAMAATAATVLPSTAFGAVTEQTKRVNERRTAQNERALSLLDERGGAWRGGSVPSPQTMRLSLILKGVAPEIADKVSAHIKGGRRRSGSFKKSRRASRSRHTRRK
jgi:hypothetical protein